MYNSGIRTKSKILLLSFILTLIVIAYNQESWIDRYINKYEPSMNFQIEEQNLIDKNVSRWVILRENHIIKVFIEGSNTKILLKEQNRNSLEFKLAKDVRSDIKNLGYLMTIREGALLIYDGAENSPRFDMSTYFNYDSSDYGLIYDCNLKTSRVNPYAHFGQPLMSQKGALLFQNDVHINSYYVGKRKTSGVQCAILNTETNELDNSAPNFQLPTGKISLFDSKHTLYRYQMFWALYLPSTVPREYSDIWRSIWSQRLMWLIDETVTFVGPKFNSELQEPVEKTNITIELQLTNLINFLLDWKCQKLKFYDCIIDLSSEMAVKGFWMNEEVDMIRLWLHDLKQIGYNLTEHVTTSTSTCKKYTNINEYSKVRFTPKFSIPKTSGQSSLSNDKLKTGLFLQKFCESSNYTLENLTQFVNNPYKLKANYTLLITFNLIVFAQNIPFIINFYSSYFKHIIFCGANIIDLLNTDQFDSLTFVEFDSSNGYYHYYCMNKVIEMGYQTEGILLASDDVLLKPWNLAKLDSNRIWFSQTLEALLELKRKATKWYWWRSNYPRLVKFFKFTKKILSGDYQLPPRELNLMKEIIHGIEDHRVNEKIVNYGGSDTFYLPRRKFELFHVAARYFKKHDIFLEIAVPTILNGIDIEKEGAELMHGIYRWSSQFSLNDYNMVVHFAHPFKLSRIISNKDEGARFCRLFIQEKINRNI